jgi:serine/threonine-protein kinase
MGTPFFMSPEQARGMKSVDHRSDLWSLAVIVFRCVTGKLPFDGESLGDLLVKICAAPVPVPSSVLPGLSPQFDAWMLKALDREPGLRFQTAHEMAESLAIVAGISVRLSSRRSNDFSPTPRPQMATATSGPAPTAQLWTPPVTPVPTGMPSQSPDMLRQPIPAGTSSPFTANATAIPMQKGVGAGALSVMAGLLLVVAAGGSFYWFTHRTTASVAIASDAPTRPAAAPPPPPSATATPPSVAPTASTVAEAPIPVLQTSKGTGFRSTTPGVPVAPPEPAKHANLGATHGASPASGGVKVSPPLPPVPASTPPAVNVPHSTPRPPPSPISGSDPGY